MKADEFTTNVANAYDAWDETKDEEKFQKKRFLAFVAENYTETELDELWRLVEKNCEKRPRISTLNKLLPGRSRGAVSYRTSAPFLNIPYGEVEFSTAAGREFAKDLAPLFSIKIAGDCTRDEFLNDEQKAVMKERSSAFFTILNGLMARKKTAENAGKIG